MVCDLNRTVLLRHPSKPVSSRYNREDFRQSGRWGVGAVVTQGNGETGRREDGEPRQWGRREPSGDFMERGEVLWISIGVHTRM